MQTQNPAIPAKMIRITSVIARVTKMQFLQAASSSCYFFSVIVGNPAINGIYPGIVIYLGIGIDPPIGIGGIYLILFMCFFYEL